MSQHELQAGAGGMACRTESGLIKRINDFMESPWFVALVCVLTACSNLFGAELIVYTLFIVFAVYTALLGRDLLPIMPLVVSCYIAPSISNNPGRNANSVFYPENGGIYLLVLLFVFIICAVVRLVTDKEIGGKAFLKKKRKLMPGMLLLGAGYMLAGAFSGRYFENGINNPVFAALQFIAVAGLYWLFSGAVRWERVHPDYFAWVGLGIGLTVCCEIAGAYINNDVITDGVVESRRIVAGWGNKNNIGCMVAMMTPFALSLARRPKWGWCFSTLGVLMLAFTCFTCSRTSIFVAFIFYVITLVVVLQDPKWRKPLLIPSGVSNVILLMILFVIFREPIIGLIQKFLELDFESIEERINDYQKGLQAFLENPVFGEGFYPSKDIYAWSTIEEFKAILPARWHNTVVQLLASCGIVGLAAYSVHRIQTIKLFLKKRNTEVLFIGLSLGAMLSMSLLDCHFFNIGPTLFYSMGLAFAENIRQKQ